MKHRQGRFRTRLHPLALTFSSSLNVDRRLFREDIAGSIAHAEMLAARRIIPQRDAKKIVRALQQIRREIARGALPRPRGRLAADDIHMAIEERLTAMLGGAGGRLHTARSRNDQIALDERLYLRRTIPGLITGIRTLQRTLLGTAERNQDVIMPGYTHLQRAQPILLAHHLLAYISMLDRDHGRFADCLRRTGESPLGAGALAGTSFPIDRKRTARRLGFPAVLVNSMDAVSDRDVLIECIGACAITMMHLSRVSEDLVLWSSQEWSFVRLADAFTTGSSIMPQKRNPDMAELVRGKTGRVYGDLVTLLTVMKGLPLAYNRDMQEDKESLFDALDTTAAALDVCAAMFRTATFNNDRFRDELRGSSLLATELADYLVRKGMAFRKAHVIVGTIVRESEQGAGRGTLTLQHLRKYSKLFDRDAELLLTPMRSITLKQSEGSTSPREVRRALQQWRRKLSRR